MHFTLQINVTRQFVFRSVSKDIIIDNNIVSTIFSLAYVHILYKYRTYARENRG